MKNRKRHFYIHSLLLLFLFLPALHLAAQTYSGYELKAITALAVSSIARLHYNSMPLDSKKCDLAFTEYLKNLDPEKMYLTALDIKEYAASAETSPACSLPAI